MRLDGQGGGWVSSLEQYAWFVQARGSDPLQGDRGPGGVEGGEASDRVERG
jgi:hypothetical protein